MAEIIRMPRLSDTMEEGVIVEWLKSVGDKVEPGDVLAEVETDKATMELENFLDGYLLHIGVEKGTVPVNGILAVIGEKGEDFKEQLEKAKSQTAASDDSNEPAEKSKDDNADKEESAKAASISKESPAQAENQSQSSEERIKASPLAKSIAKEAGVSIDSITGTGDAGRVIKKDVEDYLKNGSSSKPTTKSVNIPSSANVEYGERPVSQMRKAIARRLSESKFGAPHFYLTVEVDMTQSFEDRKQLNLILPNKISFNDMVIKAVAMALRKHPSINSSWLGDKIRTNEEINIGVAVAVSEGLLVPVINNADYKSMSQINEEVGILAGKAKEKKLQPDQMQGNTFTISNLGMFGINEFTAIINPPDACILAVGGIFDQAIVRNGQIVPGKIMKLTLSCDHRVVDGATGAQFLQTVKLMLEKPLGMMA